MKIVDYNSNHTVEAGASRKRYLLTTPYLVFYGTGIAVGEHRTTNNGGRFTCDISPRISCLMDVFASIPGRFFFLFLPGFHSK